MKRRLLVLILAVICVVLCGNAVASSAQVDEAITAMEDNIDPESLKMLDGIIFSSNQRQMQIRAIAGVMRHSCSAVIKE